MSDFSLSARTSVMAALKHAGTLTALVPAASIYPATVPANRPFPFIRINPLIATPFRASGLDSSSFRLNVQGFTRGAMPAVTAEDHAVQIGAAMQDALDGRTLALPAMKLRLTWLRTITGMDGDEPGAWFCSSFFQGDVGG